MLKIKDKKFQVKFIEMNLRERMYQEKSIVTLIINVEFYPEIFNDSVIYGAIEIKTDLENIHSLKDLVDKKYQGEIGNVSISICNDGVWESDSVDQFSISFGKLKTRMLEFSLRTDDIDLNDEGRIVSLYTTSNHELEKAFDLSDFSPIKIEKEIGKSNIIKYFIK